MFVRTSWWQAWTYFEHEVLTCFRACKDCFFPGWLVVSSSLREQSIDEAALVSICLDDCSRPNVRTCRGVFPAGRLCGKDSILSIAMQL